MSIGGLTPFTVFGSLKKTPAFSSNNSNQLSFTDKVVSAAIATLQLVPSIDEAVFNYNLPRSRMNALYHPKRRLVGTDDNKWLQSYLFPAIDAKTNRVMANKTGKPELSSTQTIAMAHGYKSSVTALLSVINYLRQLGMNVITYDARGHGESSGLRRGGYTTAIGFNSPLDMGAVLRDFKDKHPKQRLGALGYSMGASGFMFYPKRLSPDALTDAERRKISPEQLDELKQHIEGVEYLVLDSPYDTFDLMTNPVMMKKLNTIAGTPVAIKLFGSEEQAKERIINILRHFNDEGSREFLGITIPFRDFKPIETYAGSKLAEEVPTLHLHGAHDEDTLPLAQDNIRESGIIKNGEFVALDAGHSEQTLQDPGKPESGKRYFQMLRDPTTYLGKLSDFLARNEAIDPDLLSEPKVAEQLKEPNQAAILAQ